MATCLVTLRVRPGMAADFEALARSLYAASHGLGPNVGDVGLIRYEYMRSSVPHTYYCIESYEDYSSFLLHQTSPHHEAAGQQMAMIEDFKFEWVDPVPGASDLPQTNEQRISAGADERMQQYADIFPLSVASWWVSESITAPPGGPGAAALPASPGTS